VLWEKNSRTQRPNASTTKIMTATLMIESGRLQETVKFSERARRTDYANLNAKPGEQFPMSELLYAILLRSSNDSCVAVGEHLAGSPWKYAWEMTQKAKAIGANDTNFVTTNGLYHPRHFSTAFDLAVMARYAFRYPEFADAVRSQTHYIERSLNQQDRLLKNHNKFLAKYVGADGVKTGYVRQSGKCLVASATSMEAGNPWRLIAVVLKSADTYGDCAKLMDWGRLNFQPVFMSRAGSPVGEARVRDGLADRTPLQASANLVAITRRGANPRVETALHLNGDLEAPVRAGTPVGTLTARLDGRDVAQIPVETSQSVERVSASHAAVWTGWTLVLALVVLGPKYARTIAKGSRRSRRRLSTRRRSVDCGGESHC
jgi:D-alanyl-D-alanine carboxypeptidase (penicillin-binding protein 5/6)